MPVLTVPEAKSAVKPHGERITGRPWTPQEEPTTIAMILLQSGGKKMKYRESQLVHGWSEEYCKYLDYLTRLILSAQPRGDKDTDTKVRLHWLVPQKIVNVNP